MSIPFFIVISGPTGVGKTVLVDGLADKLSFPIEVVNADTGQMYAPLTIGTAKPDLDNQVVPHHLFDIIYDPEDYTASEYRKSVIQTMQEISKRGAVPVLVGGSSFYIATLFYPPCDMPTESKQSSTFKESTSEELWQKLHAIDPDRAKVLHKNDRYRIERALRLWYETGVQPSLCKPLFEPPGRGVLYYLNRDREELHERINARTDLMVEQGWLEEVRNLPEEWHEFLLTKKLIGYPEIIKYLHEQELGVLPDDAEEQLLTRIRQKTRGYAKRQVTFWKRLKKRLQESDPEGNYLLKIEEVNLTLSPHNVYIDHITRELEKLYSTIKK